VLCLIKTYELFLASGVALTTFPEVKLAALPRF
jgi:hypothetical protein